MASVRRALRGYFILTWQPRAARPCSAGFPTCCVADFPVGRVSASPDASQVWKPAKQPAWKPALRKRCEISGPGGKRLPVPEGRRWEISRGQVRSSGRGPRSRSGNGLCPSGVSEKWAVYSHFTSRFKSPRGTPAPDDGAMRRHARRGKTGGRFSDAPLGHGHTQRVNRGLRPLPRLGPRLISCGVPPGRESDGRAVLQLFRILARREDFSWSAAVCAEHQPQQVGRSGRL